MTTYGPPVIRKCPQCGARTMFHPPASGNDIDATRWLDGKVEGPMLPQWQSVVKCPECSHVYWVEDAEQLHEDSLLKAAQNNQFKALAASGTDLPKMWLARMANRHFPDPSAIDAVWSLDAGFSDLVSLAERENGALDRERRVRIKIWWMWNTGVVPWRRGECPPKSGQPHAAKNLTLLVELFDMDDIDQRMMKVEALRELGRFGEAMSLLDDVSGDLYAATVALQTELCKARDQEVRSLPAGQPTTIYLAP